MNIRIHQDEPGPRRAWYRRRGPLLAAAAAVVVAAVLVWGFVSGHDESGDPEDKPVAQVSRVRVVNGETQVTLDAATRIRGGVVVAAAGAGTGGGVNGYGTVVALDTLSVLRNAYVTAQTSVAQATARLDASRREYERLHTLERENQNESPKVVEAARAQMLADQASVEAAIAPARSAAAVARQTWGPVVGQWIVDGSPAFQRLLDGTDVLVQVSVPLDAPLGAASQTARVSAGGGAGVVARYLSPAARSDAKVQGRSFYYIAPASPMLLPGMNITASLAGAGATQGALIPDSAVVWINGAPWIYVQTGPTTFARRQISTSVRSSAGTGYVVSTVKAGTAIVVSGAQVLVSEESRSSIQVAS